MICDKVKVRRDRLKISQDRPKSYANNRRRDLEFEVGDMVFLRISPWKGVLRFGKHGKLSPRYIGPYRIVERIGEVAYQLELPSDLDRIHDVFHVSMLRKYIPDPSLVLTEQPVEIQENLTYEEEPLQILDRREQVLRNKTIPLVKVLWRSHIVEEATRLNQFNILTCRIFVETSTTHIDLCIGRCSNPFYVAINLFYWACPFDPSTSGPFLF